MKILKHPYTLIFINTLIFCFFIFLGCNSQKLEEQLKSNIDAPPNDQEIEQGETIYFNGHAVGGTPPYSYLWSFPYCFDQSSEKTPGELTFQFEGAYKVKLTVMDSMPY